MKVPLIISDPRPEADATRGTTCDALVEAIDLAPTLVDVAGGDPRSNILEGRSLPERLATPPPPPYVDYSATEPTLLVFRPVTEVTDRAGRSPLGYVGLRIRFLPWMRQNRAYRYADPESIDFERGSESTLSWEQMQSMLRFRLRERIR